MHIGFYAPFKPLGHPNPSGDLIIASGLVETLAARKHQIRVLSRLRARWIYWKPWNLLRSIWERKKISHSLVRQPLDLWLTYHSYYKAPDLLGPPICRKYNLPYIIFQGIYSTAVRRNWQTRPGYRLNTQALIAADMVLTNRRDDLANLRRLLPEERLIYLSPGINPALFAHDPSSRIKMRQQWNVDRQPVIITAAMFRPDVKTEGLIWIIESCARLTKKDLDFRLVIAGDGREKNKLIRLAEKLLGNRAIFTGRIPREKMYELYSGGDLFAFPGIDESLGMVYLEAQSCGLPVIAFDNGGIPEVVRSGETGFLTPMYDAEKFDRAVLLLLGDEAKRHQMGREAARYIRQCHDLEKNYQQLNDILTRTVRLHKKKE